VTRIVDNNNENGKKGAQWTINRSIACPGMRCAHLHDLYISESEKAIAKNRLETGPRRRQTGHSWGGVEGYPRWGQRSITGDENARELTLLSMARRQPVFQPVTSLYSRILLLY
jgi:hypothetical protein